MTVPVLDTAPVPTRTNRGALLLLGVLLTAAGLAGLLVGLGGFGAAARSQPVLPADVRVFVADHGWIWLVVVAAALLVALLSLAWLRTQMASERLRSLELERDRSRGTTTLAASAVESGCTHDLESRRGIDRASAALLGTDYDYRLSLVVYLDGREPLGRIDYLVQTEVLPRIRRVLEKPELDVRIDYRLARRPVRATR